VYAYSASSVSKEVSSNLVEVVGIGWQAINIFVRSYKSD
jgi:hypothetical protein